MLSANSTSLNLQSSPLATAVASSLTMDEDQFRSAPYSSSSTSSSTSSSSSSFSSSSHHRRHLPENDDIPMGTPTPSAPVEFMITDSDTTHLIAINQKLSTAHTSSHGISQSDTFSSSSSSSPSSSSSSSAKSLEQSHYSPFTAYCFTVNYILGVGVLGMPYAFYKAGYLLASICLLLVTLAAIATAQWIADVGARAQIIAANRERLPQSIQSIVARRFEMNQLCSFFLGPTAARIYEICITIYFVGSLWSYASVFASSFASHVPLPFANNGHECDISVDSSAACTSLYLYYVLFFACIGIPLTCLDLTEMKLLQIALAIFRFVCLATMMITSIVGIYSYPNSELNYAHMNNNINITTTISTTNSTGSTSGAPYLSDISPFVWSGLSIVFPISIYAQIFHHSVPILSQPVDVHNKRLLPRIYTSVLITTFTLYCALGICVGLYYGSSALTVCTLNWSTYTASSDSNTRTWYSEWISYMVVLFPPIDIISAFPLNAITLGQNLLTTFIRDRHRITQRRYIIPFRLLASIPPIVGACFIKDLSSILQYTGCVGVIIAFVYPCLLQYKSIQLWKQEFSQDRDEQSMIHAHSQEDDEYSPGSRDAQVPIISSSVDGKVGTLSEEVSKIDSNNGCVQEGLMGKQLTASSWFSYSPAYMSNNMPLLGSVFVFALVGLISVIVLSIVTAS